MRLTRTLILILICLTVSPLDALLEANRREAIIPYLLKPSHPIKNELDRFFSKARATHSLETLKAAGFTNVKLRWNSLLVIKHPNFPGYVFKTYVDEKPPFRKKAEENNWIKRIKGANKIRKEITKQRLDTQFKVPKKWIYELPEFPAPIPGFYPKYTLVVEEDMNILSKKENLKMWASEDLSTDILDGIKSIIHAVGFKDVKPANLPFCRDGFIAFVDTPSINQMPGYEKFTRFLSPWHQTYWIKINKK